MAFLQTVYFGSTLMQYLTFFAIILSAIIAGKIVSWVVEKVVQQLTKKTKTKLDDILVSSLRKPFIFLLFIAAAYFGQLVLSLPEAISKVFNEVLFIFFIMDLAWWLTGLLDAIITTYLKPITAKTKTDLDDTLIPIVRRVVKIFVFVIAIIVVLDRVGINVASLVAGLGLGGLAFALAAQDLLKNLFGGTAIFASKPFTVGQRIKIGTDIDGFVEEVGMRSTRIRTFDGTYLIVPNSQVADSVIENVSREKARRIVQVLGVEYDTSIKKLELAKKVIAEIVKKNADTEDDSLVYFDEFGASSLNIKVIYWIKNKDNILGAKDAINMEIKKEFEKAKIEFAYPTQTVILKKN